MRRISSAPLELYIITHQRAFLCEIDDIQGSRLDFLVRILTFLSGYVTIIVLDNFINLNGLYVGKNVGLARHIRSGVKLSSNNERNCVFRCVVSATHFLIFGGKANEKNITYY